MINFGSAADKLFLNLEYRLISRYKGPPVRIPGHAPSIASLTSGVATPSYDTSGYDTPGYPESIAESFSDSSRSGRRSRSRSRSRNRHPDRNRANDNRYDVDPREAFYVDWDLVPPAKERVFPNWGDIHRSVPETLGSVSSRTLEALTDHNVINNQPTIPCPKDIATINIIKKKLEDWEKDEEDLYLRREGWYSHSPHVEERSRRSWIKTQNRDFGSAVWRWMHLNDWDATQTNRMKGLYDPRLR